MALKQVVCVLVLLSICMCRATNISKDDDIELEEQLKLLNKPPVETFQTKEGDIIDCVDIDKQLALDHPLLKNHKVQRKPNLPLRSFSKAPSGVKYVQFQSRKPCPVGTVPIQRIRKEDLIRTRSLPKRPPVNTDEILDGSPPGLHRATLRHVDPNVIKYGASAYISVYNLTVASDQYSFHPIWISTGPLDRISMIVAGWQVDPDVSGDYITRVSTFWTGDGWRDGCYNTLCPGFVQVDSIITPNYPIITVSTPGGPIYELKVEVSQDAVTGNWWLHLHDPPINVGYWPKELFLNLQNGTFTTVWGGIAQESADGFCPPMGNGELPDEDYRKAAYFRKVEWMDANGESFPPNEALLEEVDAQPYCYGLLNLDSTSDPWGYHFSFGGPGGYCRE